MTIETGVRRDAWKVVTGIAPADLEVTLQQWTDEGYTFFTMGWSGASYDLVFKMILPKP